MKKLIRVTTVPISLDLLLKDQMKFMKKTFEVIGVSSPGEILDRVSIDQGVPVYGIEMTRKITPLKDLRAIWEMYRLLRNENPDIIHSHTPKAGLVSMVAGWLAGVPIRLHTVAGLPLMEAHGLKRTILFIIEKIVYLLATQVYPNSFGLMDYIVKERLVKISKLKVLGDGSSNGIDLDFFYETEDIKKRKNQLYNDLSIDRNATIYLFVGRLVKDKGVNELLNTFNEISSNNKNAHLILLGEFEDALDPISDSSKFILKKNENIYCCGFQPDIRPYLSLADIFVFPSYREGFPNVVMQACAFNLPCIVTDINGCNEIIDHNKNGLVIPPKNEPALKSTLLRFLEESSLIKSLGETNRKKIEAKYDRKKVQTCLKDEYELKLSELV